MISRSFGFSVTGTKEEALAQLSDVSTENRPEHSAAIVEAVRQAIGQLAEHTTVSITINTHIEDAPKPQPIIEPEPAEEKAE